MSEEASIKDGKTLKSLSHFEPDQIKYNSKLPRYFLRNTSYKELATGMMKTNKLLINDDLKEAVHKTTGHPEEDFFATAVKKGKVQFKSGDVQLEVFEQRVHAQIQHERLFQKDINTTKEILRMSKSFMYDDMEDTLLNHKRFGLKALVDDRFIINADPRRAGPCSDYLDELFSVVWKDPKNSNFVVHPKTLASICKEFIRDGTIIGQTVRNGTRFLAYHDIAFIPSDRVPLKTTEDGEVLSDIYLVRNSTRELAGYTRLGASPDGSDKNGDIHVTELQINEAGARDLHLAYYMSAYSFTPDSIAVARDLKISDNPNIEKMAG